MFARPRIAFFGNSGFSRIVLAALARRGVLPDLVVTTPDKPKGRAMTPTPTPTKSWAEEHAVEYVEAAKLKDPAFLERMRPYDLYIVASYGKIIPAALIALPKHGVLNVHPSLLPKYRGPSPLQAQILADEQHVGVSIMRIDEEVDHGPILAQREIAVPGWPVGFSKLSELLGRAGADLLADVLPDYVAGTAALREQNHASATFTKKIEKSDGLIDRAGDPRTNYLKILAYEEWPQAYFMFERGGRQLRAIVRQAAWKDGALEILRVLPEGKKEMSYADFERGFGGR